MTSLLLVLHAHLPWGHLADEDDAAAQWMLEAHVDCYQPLLETLERLAADGVPFRITLSVSPTLAAMWNSALLAPRLARYLDAERAKYSRASAKYAAAAAFHLERLDKPRRDLLEGFSRLPQIELICSTATHGFLPLLSMVPAAGRAQVQIAARSQLTAPAGMWLAECAYCPGADRWVLETGARYCFVDSHAIAHAEHAHRRSVRTEAGLYVFARDPAASARVWSRESGYPGDRAYLDFHHRIDGCRLLKVPGDDPWDPKVALERAQTHARDFVEQCQASDAQVIVAPYDAELFGHWWFEGPAFLEAVIRQVAQSSTLKLSTGSDHLEEFPPSERLEPMTSSWGRGGYSAVWLDPTNAWIWPHLHRAAEKMVSLAKGPRSASDSLRSRALAQAARELLLAQASDWPFLLEANTHAHYATARFEDHLIAFRTLADQLDHDAIDPVGLQLREVANNLFGSIDVEVYGVDSWPQP